MIGILATLVLSSHSYLAGEPLPPPPKSKEFTIAQPDGPVVFGIRVEDRFQQLETKEYSLVDLCHNHCTGKVHDSHAACDFSCDQRCKQGMHRGSVSLHLTQGPKRKDYIQELRDAFDKFGVPKDEHPMGQVMDHDSVIRLLEGPKYEATYKKQCWNKTPCSAHYLQAEYLLWQKKKTYRLFRVENGTKVWGPKVEGDGECYAAPSGNFTLLPPTDRCSCDIAKKEEPTETGGSGAQGMVFPVGPSEGYVAGGIPATPKDLDKANVEVVCNDINTATVAGTWSGMPDGFYFPAGTILNSLDPKVQDTILITPIAVDRGQVRGGPSAEWLAQTGRIMCLEMLKKEPSPKVKFVPLTNFDPVLIRLARLAETERVRGPHIQMRFWIATDAATYAEIDKVLMPMPNHRSYVECMHQVATIGGLEFLGTKRERCFQPEQIVWGSLSTEAAAWLVRHLAALRPKETAAFIQKNLQAFAWMFDEGANPYGIEIPAALARSLCNSGSPELRVAGLRMLAGAVPDSARQELAAAGGLSFAGRALIEGDAGSVEIISKLVQAYGREPFKLSLMNPHPNLGVEAAAICRQLRQGS